MKPLTQFWQVVLICVGIPASLALNVAQHPEKPGEAADAKVATAVFWAQQHGLDVDVRDFELRVAGDCDKLTLLGRDWGFPCDSSASGYARGLTIPGSPCIIYVCPEFTVGTLEHELVHVALWKSKEAADGDPKHAKPIWRRLRL